MATVHTVTSSIISQAHWLKLLGSGHSWEQAISGLIKTT